MDSLDITVERFLTIGYGDGYGSGDGVGDGYGVGYGYGDGYGVGVGVGDGDGYGDGYGFGYGVDALDGQRVHMIDGVPTVIHAVRGNIARCGIMQQDWSLKPCWVARVGDCFAHGATVHEAWHDAQAKHTQRMPVEERISMFNEQFPDRDKPVAVKTLYDWHGILTGSCRMGRNEFAKSHDIDLVNDTMTVNEFIRLTADSYGGDVIKQL